MSWNAAARLPLIMRFPGAERRGRISLNSQRIDIAPTLLAGIGAPVPEWMGGRSLLAVDLDPMIPIIATENRAGRFVGGWRQVANPGPPFHTLGGVSVVICQRYYELLFKNLQRTRMRSATIKDHTDPCPEDELPTEEAMRSFIVEHLEAAGYDVTLLREGVNPRD
jgi:hypothetical protein